MPHDIATSTWSVQRNTENSKRFPAGFWAAMYYIWTIYTWKAIIPLFLSNSLDCFFCYGFDCLEPLV